MGCWVRLASLACPRLADTFTIIMLCCASRRLLPLCLPASGPAAKILLIAYLETQVCTSMLWVYSLSPSCSPACWYHPQASQVSQRGAAVLLCLKRKPSIAPPSPKFIPPTQPKPTSPPPKEKKKTLSRSLGRSLNVLRTQWQKTAENSPLSHARMSVFLPLTALMQTALPGWFGVHNSLPSPSLYLQPD